METKDEQLRGPLLVLINREIDLVKARNLGKAELVCKALRTCLCKREVNFRNVSWVYDILDCTDETEYPSKL
jgi:hypothetical protein